MKKPIPQVREFMTRTPIIAEANSSLYQLRQVMQKSNIRHLPVEKDGKIVGVVSERGLKSALGLDQSEKLSAADIMSPEPFTVSPDTSLEEVAAIMAEEKYGSVLVKDENNQLQGIFTSVDACRALRQILETNFPE